MLMNEPNEPIDENAAEINGAIEAVNAAFLEAERHERVVANLFGWMDFAEKTLGAIEGFRERVGLVPSLLAVMTDEPRWHFLRGSQYCAVMAAYERFVHEVFELMIFSDEHFQCVKKVLASDWPKNDKHDQHVVLIGLKKKSIDVLSQEELAEVFRKTTLNDATRIASSVEKLFDLKFPVPQRFDLVCNIRNVFTHNAGVGDDGQLQTLSLGDVEQLIEEVDGLVAAYATALMKKAEAAVGI